MAQKFYAHPEDYLTHNNGAVGYRTGAQFDCLGPYAKVKNCPVLVNDQEVARLTCYATGYADTAFSVPACTRYKGKHVTGYFTDDEGGTTFRVVNKSAHLFNGA